MAGIFPRLFLVLDLFIRNFLLEVWWWHCPGDLQLCPPTTAHGGGLWVQPWVALGTPCFLGPCVKGKCWWRWVFLHSNILIRAIELTPSCWHLRLPAGGWHWFPVLWGWVDSVPKSVWHLQAPADSGCMTYSWTRHCVYQCVLPQMDAFRINDC